MQNNSTKLAECDTMEEKQRAKSLFSSLTEEEKKDVLLFAERILNQKKE